MLLAMGTGMSAIEEVLRARYPGQAPAAVFPGAAAGAATAPLREVRVYRHPQGHWHYVALGLSELDEKVSEDPSRSGWGIELTLRLEAPAVEREPPRWPAEMLADLAEYVHSTKNPFGEGHHVDRSDSPEPALPEMSALAFGRDPELGTITTANGPLHFLQVVELRADEAALAARWSVTAFLELLQRRVPLLVTRPGRRSLLEDPELGPLALSRADAEGSAQTAAVAETLSWRSPWWSGRRLDIFLGPGDVARRNLRRMLADRAERGRDLRIHGMGRTWAILPGGRDAWKVENQTLHLTASSALIAELKRFLEGEARVLPSAALPGLSLNLVD
jgi:hypothetical protein